MLDIILMISLAGRLRMSYAAAGKKSSGKVFKMIAFWFAAESLVMGACLNLGMELILTTLLSMGAGLVTGFAAFQQAMAALNAGQGNDGGKQ